MSKNREDQAQEPKTPKPATVAAEHDDGDDAGDDGPDVQTRQDGENTVVEGSGESRSERRRRQRDERIAREQAERRQTTETIESLRRTVEALSARVGQAPAPQAQQPRQDDPDEVDPEWQKLTDRQVELSQLMQGARTREDQEKIMGEWRKAEFKKQKIVASRTMAPELERVRSAPQAEPVEITMIRQEFADVLADKDASALAQAYANAEMVRARRDRRVVNPAQVHRDALTRAGIELGMRNVRAPAPTDAQRGRLAGFAPGSSGANGGAFSRPLTKRELTLARIWADGTGIPEDKVATEWAKMMVKDDPNYFRDNQG